MAEVTEVHYGGSSEIRTQPELKEFDEMCDNKSRSMLAVNRNSRLESGSRFR